MQIFKIIKVARFIIGPRMSLFFVYVLITLLVSIVEISSVYCLAPLLDSFFGNTVEAPLMERLVFLENKTLNFSLLLLFLAALSFLIRSFACYISAEIVQRIVVYWSRDMINTTIYAPTKNIARYPPGELNYLNVRGYNSVSNFLKKLNLFIANSVTLLCFCVLLYVLSPYGTLLIAPLGLFLMLIIRLVSRVIIFEASQRSTKASIDRSVLIQEIIVGLKTIKIYRAIDDFLAKHEEQLKEIKSNFIKMQASGEILGHFARFALLAGISLFMIYVSCSESPWTQHLGLLGAYVAALTRVIPLINNVSDAYLMIVKFLPICKRFQDFLAKEKRATQDIELGSSKIESIGEIRFEGVTLQLADKTVLQDLNFVIPAGRKVALVGQSGSGKSSLLNVMLKLVRPQFGEVKVDGESLKSITTQSLYEKIGFVAQDGFLFHDSLRNNLQMFRSSFSDEQLYQALEFTMMDEFVRRLPQGLDTILESDGSNVSGGEKQRICLARALLASPDALILDEATSAIDQENEKAIIENLFSLYADKTIVFVSHRLSSLTRVEDILVLSKGELVEQGSFKELMEKQGKYYQMYHSSEQ